MDMDLIILLKVSKEMENGMMDKELNGLKMMFYH